MVQENMVELNNLNKGGNMEIMPYRLSEEVYETINANFSEKRDRDIVIFCLQQNLGNQSKVVIDTVNRKIDQIIYEVKIELSKEFATKSDLEAVKSALEKQIAEVRTEIEKRFGGIEKRFTEIEKRIFDVKDELKQDISDVKVEMEKRFGEMEKRFGETNTRITNVRSELKEDISNLKVELKKDISDVKQDVSDLKIIVGKLDQKIDGIGKIIKGIAGVGGTVLAGVIVALITKYFHLIWQ